MFEICRCAESDKSIIWNMFQFYCYDTSEYDGYDVQPNGFYRMCADYFAQYWTQPRWSAYLLRVDGALAGFALIEPSDVDANALELADLFIMRKYRRRGLAQFVVEHFLGQRDTPWTITVFDDAGDAKAFWQRIFGLPGMQVTQVFADPDDRAAQVHWLPANQG